MGSARLFQRQRGKGDSSLAAAVQRALSRQEALPPSDRVSADALRRLTTLLGVYVGTVRESLPNSMARRMARERIEQMIAALCNGIDSVGYMSGSSGDIALLTKKDRKAALKMYRKALKDIS